MIHVNKPNSGPSNGGRESPGVFGNVCAARQHMQEHWPRHLCRRFKEVSVGEAWYTLSILWDFFHPFLSDTTLVGFSDTAIVPEYYNGKCTRPPGQVDIVDSAGVAGHLTQSLAYCFPVQVLLQSLYHFRRR